MELNIISLLYLFFRLAPFIIVCYFSLASLFNQDMKGLIYLVGLLFACFCTFLVGQSFSFETEGEKANICSLITVGNVGSFSKLPLGVTVLGYTFFYLVHIIVSKNLSAFNIPTLVFFPLLILADIIWNIMNNCYNIGGIIVSLIVGSIVGVIWAGVIAKMNNPSLLFLNIGSGQTACQRPSKQLFKCTFPERKTD
jgi:hypothetical protein